MLTSIERIGRVIVSLADKRGHFVVIFLHQLVWVITTELVVGLWRVICFHKLVGVVTTRLVVVLRIANSAIHLARRRKRHSVEK